MTSSATFDSYRKWVGLLLLLLYRVTLQHSCFLFIECGATIHTFPVCLFQEQQKPNGSRMLQPYDRDRLRLAYEATLNGMSVYRASRAYRVPESTLRDRTRKNVAVDCFHGGETLLTHEEEKAFADHIQYMASIGYGYSKSNIQYMGVEYARSLGKPIKINQTSLSNTWFYAFMGRWSTLKLSKPQKLQLCRAKSASQEKIDKYFNDLEDILVNNDLLEHPERIYNIDETGIYKHRTFTP